VGAALVLLAACGDDAGLADADGGPATGAACVPENVPTGGFSSAEIFLETLSRQCHREVCLVYQLEGDPTTTREACLDEGRDPASCETYPVADERESRVHCTCRCEAPSPDADTCACPSGFACVPLLDLEAGPDVAGSYCVHDAVAP